MEKRALVIGRLLIATLAVSTEIFAQNAAVPASEAGTYDELQSKLQAFNQTVSSQWNGQRSGMLFSGELLYADSNSGLQLLAPGIRSKYLDEINGLQALGNQAVVVKIGFPFLCQPFFVFNGDPGDYNNVLAFYQQVAADVHAAGMKMIVETESNFQGFFATGSGLNLAGFYAATTYDQFLADVAVSNATIVSEIQPDYLNMGSEPTTDAQNTGYTQLASPSAWASAIQTMASMIPSPHPIPLGSGVGSWEISDGADYVSALAPVVDYIDLHVYPINDPPGSTVDIPTNTIDLINQAESLNKPVAISEMWLLKLSDEDYASGSAQGVSTSVQNFSQDVFSFWAPLDQSFLNVMNDLGNWKGLMYASAFWTRYYWSYLDYDQVSSEPAETLLTNVTQTAASALTGKKVTSTGLYVGGMLTGSSGGMTLATAANFSSAGVASNSLVSIFGANLANTTASPSSGLPTTLGGVSVTITDCVGTTQPLSLFFVSQLQVNALIPAGLANGNATLTLTNGSNTVTGNVRIESVNPGLFSKSGTGSGVAAAQVLTYQSDGSSAYTNAFTLSGSSFVPAPIVVNGSGTQVYLVLYGTGIQGRDKLSNVTASIGGEDANVTFAGAQGGFSGLDQINVLLPSSLAGIGTTSVQLKVDGIKTNSVQIEIQ